jgi:hypothetical protein
MAFRPFEIAVQQNGAWYPDYNGDLQWDASDTGMIKSFGVVGEGHPVAGKWKKSLFPSNILHQVQ